MEFKTIKTANKIIYVKRWIIAYNKDDKYKSVEANQLPNGKWLCEIKIPLLNKTVKTISTFEINAILNAAEKATKLIQNYLKDHPEVKWAPLSKFRHWKIGYNEYGFAELYLDRKYREKIDEDMLRTRKESSRAVEKAIARIKRVIGTDKNLFIQVIDRSLFDENASDDEAFKKIFDAMYNEHNIHVDNIQSTNDGTHVIVVGYTVLREEFEKCFK